MIKSLFVVILLSMATASANQQIILGTANSVTLRGAIGGGSAASTMKSLYDLDKARGTQNYPLYLVLDSPGGSIIAGNALIQYAKTIRNLHTITIFSASMAAAIVEGLPGNRYITENGVLMFHRASLGMEGQIEEGEFESRLGFFKRMVLLMEVANSSRMGMSLEDYKNSVKDEMWLLAPDSMSKRAADAIVDIRCTNELVEASENYKVDLLFTTINLKFSKCPLFRSPTVGADEQESYSKNIEAIRKQFSKDTI